MLLRYGDAGSERPGVLEGIEGLGGRHPSVTVPRAK